MTYASKGAKIFEMRDPKHPDCTPLPLVKRSDHRLKRLESLDDRRAWDICERVRYTYLLELMTGSKTCLEERVKCVPTEDVISILSQNEAGTSKVRTEEEFRELTEELNRSRDLLREAMRKLQNIDEIVTENKKLQCRLRMSEERVKFLEEKKKRLENELADLRSKSQIQIDLEKAQEMLSKVTKQREDPKGIGENDLRRLTVERDELQEKVKQLQKELEDSRKAEAEIEILRKQSESDSLDREEMSRENECYRKKLLSMKCLEKQVLELKKQGRALADKYKRQSLKAAEQMEKMRQAAKELQALTDERDSLRKRVNDLASYECEYKKLQKKLQQVDCVIQENENLNSKLRALQKLEKENECLRCKLQSMQEMELKAADDKEKIMQLQCAVADQEEEMKELLCQIEKLTSGKHEEELERLKCELYEKSSKLKLCEEQLAEIPMLEAEIDELRMKLQSCCKDFSETKRGESKYQKVEIRFPCSSKEIKANYKTQRCKCQEISHLDNATTSKTSTKVTDQKESMSCEEVQNLLQSSKGIISCVLEDMIEHQKEMEELEICNKLMKEEVEMLKAKVGITDKDCWFEEIKCLKKALHEKEEEIKKMQEAGDIETLKQLNAQMKAELKAACEGLKQVGELEKILEKEHKARCEAEKRLGFQAPGFKPEDLGSDCCAVLQKETEDLKFQIKKLNELTEELKKENELLRELQQPCPDFSKELEEKCALENLLSLLQAELDAFKGQKLNDECEALRNELKRVMEQNCQLKALVNCYRQRLDLEKTSTALRQKQLEAVPEEPLRERKEVEEGEAEERKKKPVAEEVVVPKKEEEEEEEKEEEPKKPVLREEKEEEEKVKVPIKKEPVAEEEAKIPEEVKVEPVVEPVKRPPSPPEEKPKPVEEPVKAPPEEKPKPIEEPVKKPPTPPEEKPKPVEEPVKPPPEEKPKPVEEPVKKPPTPPEEKPKPVEEPVKKPPTPPEEKPKPVEEPVKKPPTPPEEKPKPVEEPVKKPPTPPEEKPKPVEEPVKKPPTPPEEKPKPVEEPVKPPPEEKPKPVEEPVKAPPEEKPKPVEEPVKPPPEEKPKPVEEPVKAPPEEKPKPVQEPVKPPPEEKVVPSKEDNAALKECLDKLKRLEEENAEKIKKLMDQHAKEMADQEKKYNDNMNAMKSGYETDIRKLAERHKMSMMRLQGLHEDQVQEMNLNHETQLETMQTQSQAAINEVAQGSAAKMRKLSEQHAKEMQQLENKYNGALDGLQDALSRSKQELETLKRKMQGMDADGDQDKLKAQHAREMQKARKSSKQKVDTMKELLEETKRQSKAEIESLKQQLKDQERGDGIGRKKPKRPRDPRCPLDFDEVLEKILEEGMDALTFNEIALVHRKACCALEKIVMKSKTVPGDLLELEPAVLNTCSHTSIFEADKQRLLSRIFALEEEITQRQKQTQEHILSMEVAIKKERCRLQELRTSLQYEQQKNSELKLLLTSQSKLQINLKKERDQLGNQASLHQSLCEEKSKQLNEEIRNKRCLEAEVEKLKEALCDLHRALDEERGSSTNNQRDQLELMRQKLEQSVHQERMLALELERENKCRREVQCQLQTLRQSLKHMVCLPSVESMDRFCPSPLEAKSVKEKQNLDQMNEKKSKTKTKVVKKHKK